MTKFKVEKINATPSSFSDSNFIQPSSQRSAPPNALPIEIAIKVDVDPFK